MPIHLNFAPTAVELLPSLVEKLRSNLTDIFNPPVLLVPNPALGRWLQLRLAHENTGLGCVLGLPMDTLERFLRESLVRGLSPAQIPKELSLPIFTQVLIPLLGEMQLPEVVQNYLMGKSHNIDMGRKLQLASRLATLFQEYEFNRPSVWDSRTQSFRVEGIEKCWMGGKTYFSGKEDITENWQRSLYKQARTITDGKFASLPVLYSMRQAGILAPEKKWQAEKGSVFLFQVSKISHFHRNALIEISQMPGVDLHVYLTNPCADFWEDVGRRMVRKSWSSKDASARQGILPRQSEDYQKQSLGEIVNLPKEQPLLQLWGETGKENIYLWCPATEWDFTYTASEKDEPKTLLNGIQQALLNRSYQLPPCAAPGWTPDNSLQILEAPSVVREVEVLLQNIIQLLAENADLRLEDIVVYLNDAPSYLSAIEGVFGSTAPWEEGYVAYNILQAPGTDSVFSQGMKALLDIASGSFDRSTVFRLFRNPIVQKALQIDSKQVMVWERWAQNLGIFRGYDQAHRASMGDLGECITDEHTFAFGMGRLLLGDLSAIPQDLGMSLPLPPYRDRESGDGDLIAGFCSAIERLFRGTQLPLHTMRRPTEWVSWWREQIKTWFPAIPDDLGNRRSAEVRVHAEFLMELEVIAIQENCAGRQELSYQESQALLLSLLPDELPASNRAWTGGITFAPLRQGMVIPHKHIFVLGLDAKNFPGEKNDMPFDLLRRRRLVGDADPVRGNRFTFLELLHAAQHSLILSYQSRNMQKEEELQPSSVILELEYWLLGLLPNKASLRREIPWLDFKNTPMEVLLNEKRHGLRYKSVARSPNNARPAKNQINIWQLKNFLQNPLEYHLRIALGIQEDSPPETMGAVDEPLELSKLHTSHLCSKVLTSLICNLFSENTGLANTSHAQLETIARTNLQKEYLAMRMEGIAPEAQLSKMEITKLEKSICESIPQWLDLKINYPDYFLVQDREYQWKTNWTHANSNQVTIGFAQKLTLVPRNYEKNRGILLVEFNRDGDLSLRNWLNAVLHNMLMRSRSRYLQGGEVCVVVCSIKDGKISNHKFYDAMDSKWEELQVWLEKILQFMLVHRENRHLPLEEVKAIVGKSAKEPISWEKLTMQALDDLRENQNPYNSYLSAFGLVSTKEITLQNPQELQKLAKDLFAPLVEKWVNI